MAFEMKEYVGFEPSETVKKDKLDKKSKPSSKQIKKQSTKK